MIVRRSVLTAGLALIPAALAPALQAANDPVSFVNALGNQVLGVIRSNASIEQKNVYFHLVLDRDFDIPAIAAFVLGRFWRIATEPERQQILHLLDDYIVVTFGRRLYGYGGERLRVIGSRGTLYEPIVASEIVRPGGRPIRLDWVLNGRSGAYRIIDLVLDGISMVVTQRSEFGRIIERAGGTIAGLITVLQQIIAGAFG